MATRTLSDIAVEICYVDAKGELQCVTDAEELRVASGCFGLLGVVVSMTLQLDVMEVAQMRPYRSSVFLTIPPPEGYQVPEALKEAYAKCTKEQLEKAKQEFMERCEKDYYLEWFWFPYQDECWVNTWQSECEFEDISRTVAHEAGLVERPTEIKDVNMKTYPDADDQAWQVVSLSCSMHSVSLK